MPPETARVVVLSGPSAAGRTTVATLLLAVAGRPTVSLTTDHFARSIATGPDAPHPPGPGSQQQDDVVVAAVVAATEQYVRGGYDVVVDGVLGTALLRPFRAAAARSGWDLHYLVLRAVDAVVTDLGDLEAHAVDTHDLDPAATADVVRTGLAADRFRIAADPRPRSAPEARTEPPLRGDELATLRGYLDHHRDTLRWKTAGLDAHQLAAPLAPSTMTLGGLLKHLAYVESNWFTVVLAGNDPLAPFDDVDWSKDPDWEWHSAAHDSPETLRALYETAVSASDVRLDAALAAGGLDQLSVRESRHHGGRFSLRWILAHMVEEYARHNGHADLLREAVDGQHGD